MSRRRELPDKAGIATIKVHRCVDGGLLYEIYRCEGFGQLTARTISPGQTAGGHKHPITNEAWTFYRGRGVVYLEYENGIREMRYIDTSEGPVTIKLPAGTGHDVKCTGDEELVFIFFSDRLYDPKTHDKVAWSWE